MKRTSDVTILGTVVYGISISTTTFTLAYITRVNANVSKSLKKLSPTIIGDETNLQRLSPQVCKKKQSPWDLFSKNISSANITANRNVLLEINMLVFTYFCLSKYVYKPKLSYAGTNQEKIKTEHFKINQYRKYIRLLSYAGTNQEIIKIEHFKINK